MILTRAFVAWVNQGYNRMIYPTTYITAHMHRCKAWIPITTVIFQLLVDPDPDINVHVSGLATRWRPRLVAIFKSGFIATKSSTEME